MQHAAPLPIERDTVRILDGPVDVLRRSIKSLSSRQAGRRAGSRVGRQAGRQLTLMSWKKFVRTIMENHDTVQCKRPHGQLRPLN